MNTHNLQQILANRDAIIARAKTMTREELIALDAEMDTLVFGRPLGLKGELINALQPMMLEDMDDQTQIEEYYGD